MSLKRELEQPLSPIRSFFATQLNHSDRALETMRSALDGAASTLPSPADDEIVPWDVLGHAISARLAWELDGAPRGHIGGSDLGQLMALCGDVEAALPYLELASKRPAQLDALLAARVAFLAGLMDRARRSARRPDRWLDALVEARSWEELLAVVPHWCAQDVAAVTSTCAGALEVLRGGPAVADVTFAGSAAVGGADADVIVGTTLVEIKAFQKPVLHLRELHQLVSYALLDWDDDHHLDSVALLAARQGRLVRWDLEELLCELAGRVVSVAELQDQLRCHLSTNPVSRQRGS